MTDLIVPEGEPLGDEALFEAASRLIEEGQAAVSYHANAVALLTNWRLGRLIHVEVLHRGRADYGKQIVATLSRQLEARYSQGYEVTTLRRMIQFATTFPEGQLTALPSQLSWSHIKELLPLKSPGAIAFYVEEIGTKNLAVRDLRKVIGRKAFERRDIANSQIPPGSAVPLDAFRDPMLLDMLSLKDGYLETDLEQAILRDLEAFFLEVGRGFTFAGRQVRMTVGGEDYHLDLLFFSRPLRRLVAVELKIGKFKPAYFGQMRLYLKWLERYDREEGEQAPVGLILCTEADRDAIELLELHKDNVVVAEYWTDFIPRKELEDRLQTILRDARERMARRTLPNTGDSLSTWSSDIHV
jgi:predicted nuclease of restriction endonuclease-like (RecB) superfamily